MSLIKRISALLLTLILVVSLGACRQEEEQVEVIPTVLKETPVKEEEPLEEPAVRDTDGENVLPANFFNEKYGDKIVTPVLLDATLDGALIKIDSKSQKGTRTLAIWRWNGTADDPELLLELAEEDILVHAAAGSPEALYLSLEDFTEGTVELRRCAIKEGTASKGETLRQETLQDLLQIPGLSLHDGRLYYWWTDGTGDDTTANLAVYDPESGEIQSLDRETGRTILLQNRVMQIPGEPFVFMYFRKGPFDIEGMTVDHFDIQDNTRSRSTWPFEGFDYSIYWNDGSYSWNTYAWMKGGPTEKQESDHQMRRIGGDTPDVIFWDWPADLILQEAFPIADDELLLVGKDFAGDTRYFKLKARFFKHNGEDELTELSGLPTDRDVFQYVRFGDGGFFYSQDAFERNIYCRPF